jgi:hypothetical protein
MKNNLSPQQIAQRAWEKWRLISPDLKAGVPA